MTVTRVLAPAKVNLFLNVLGPRTDGFHDVRFLMHPIALADELLIEPTDDGCLQFTCSVPELAGTDNLVTQAYEAFYAATQLPREGIRVHLVKHIPIQAGLGGGSSDAAAMLRWLNETHQAPLSHEALNVLAANLGSDVPFFLQSGHAKVEGRGECLTPLPGRPEMAIALLKPHDVSVSTPEAYGWLREQAAYRERPFPVWPGPLAGLLHNDFEPVVFARFPQLAHAKAQLLALSCPGVLMSGSGPTLFAVLDTPDRQWPAICTAFGAAQWWRCLSTLARPKD